MNREQAKKMLPIIQAFADGAEIQRAAPNGDWVDFPPWAEPNFAHPSEYRIKPKPLEGWATVDCQNQASFHATKDEAEKALANGLGLCAPYRVIHMREVIE